MSDGGGGVKGGLKQAVRDIGEAIAPIKDGVIEMAEENVSLSTAGIIAPQNPQPLDPEARAKKRAEEDARIQKANKTLHMEWQANLQKDQAKAHQDFVQRETERTKQKDQTEQVKQFEVKKVEAKKNAALAARSTTETRKGVQG